MENEGQRKNVGGELDESGVRSLLNGAVDDGNFHPGIFFAFDIDSDDTRLFVLSRNELDVSDKKFYLASRDKEKLYKLRGYYGKEKVKALDDTLLCPDDQEALFEKNDDLVLLEVPSHLVLRYLTPKNVNTVRKALHIPEPFGKKDIEYYQGVPFIPVLCCAVDDDYRQYHNKFIPGFPCQYHSAFETIKDKIDGYEDFDILLFRQALNKYLTKGIDGGDSLPFYDVEKYFLSLKKNEDKKYFSLFPEVKADCSDILIAKLTEVILFALAYNVEWSFLYEKGNLANNLEKYDEYKKKHFTDKGIYVPKGTEEIVMNIRQKIDTRDSDALQEMQSSKRPRLTIATKTEVGNATRKPWNSYFSGPTQYFTPKVFKERQSAARNGKNKPSPARFF